MSGLCLLTSYPKSGNTWMRLALSSLQNNGASVELGAWEIPWWDLSGGNLLAGIISDRNWFDEYVGVESSELAEGEIDAFRGASVRQIQAEILAECRDAPYFMKVHDAFRTKDGHAMYPPAAISQVIYIVRDPRDVLSSLADHMGITLPEAASSMSQPDFTLARQNSKIKTQLPQRLSSWSSHVTGWLDSGLSLILVRYEDMIADMAHELRRVADFAGLSASDDAIRRAVEATRFDRLQAQETETGFREKSVFSERFFRKGRAGGWRTDVPPELVAQIERDHGAVMRRLGYLSGAE